MTINDAELPKELRAHAEQLAAHATTLDGRTTNKKFLRLTVVLLNRGADAIERLSASGAAQDELPEADPCPGVACCNESYERLLKLLHERGYCETCDGTGTMHAMVGYNPNTGQEILQPETCGECGGVAGRAGAGQDERAQLRKLIQGRIAISEEAGRDPEVSAYHAGCMGLGRCLLDDIDEIERPTQPTEEAKSSVISAPPPTD